MNTAVRQNDSLPSLLAQLSEVDQAAILAELRGIRDEDAYKLLHDWKFWARPNQLPPPGDWHVWMVLAGRGFGKSRLGAEWVRARAESGSAGYTALVAETAADARDVMIEGPSGLLAITPKRDRPKYEPSKRRLTWPNGAVATTYAGTDPEQLRGPQHDTAWVDELAKFAYPDDTWSNLMFGLRMGSQPRCVVTTTPRPIKLIKELIKSPGTVVTRGSTYENRANLAPSFFETIIKRYEGSRLGRQELLAEILDQREGALWSREMIHYQPQAPDLDRIVVAIDPAVTSGEDSDETGIVVAGRGADGHGYILEDLSGRLSPDAWTRRAVNAYLEYQADRIVAEVNNGGDMVEQLIRTVNRQVAYRAVRASRGKSIRAEPIAALYEQGRVFHHGVFPALEDQLCEFIPGAQDTPVDRLDALVWALTDLMLGPQFIYQTVAIKGL